MGAGRGIRAYRRIGGRRHRPSTRRPPGLIQSAMILAAALIEGVALIALVVALLVVFKS